MVTLCDELLIGEGGERRCYSLPDNRDFCVKITKEGLSGRLEQSLVEYDYYQLLKKRNIPLDHIPECYGWIDTNLGKGLVYERVFSTSARLDSFTLRTALNSGVINFDVALHILKQLLSYLSRYNFIVSDLSMNNLILHFGESWKLYLVDGVGGRNLDWKYKVRKRVPLYARYKIKQQWPKLFDEINNEFPLGF
ncbi:MAG: YrbL family protein [Salegentibacter mishustinae]|nr:YrbL family protein [Salegentibacter mishustinae]